LQRAGFGILPKQSSCNRYSIAQQKKFATTECRRQHAASARSPEVAVTRALG
jgi:hypothetical protein